MLKNGEMVEVEKMAKAVASLKADSSEDKWAGSKLGLALTPPLDFLTWSSRWSLTHSTRCPVPVAKPVSVLLKSHLFATIQSHFRKPNFSPTLSIDWSIELEATKLSRTKGFSWLTTSRPRFLVLAITAEFEAHSWYKSGRRLELYGDYYGLL